MFKLPENIVDDLKYFAAPRTGRLTSQPLEKTNTKYDYECAKVCLDYGDSCVAFDFDYGEGHCHAHWTIEGMQADLVISGAYMNFEKLGGGQSAYFSFDGGLIKCTCTCNAFLHAVFVWQDFYMFKRSFLHDTALSTKVFSSMFTNNLPCYLYRPGSDSRPVVLPQRSHHQRARLRVVPGG